MRFRDLRFLADENISPKVVRSLRDQGLDAPDVKEEGWQGKSDEEMLEISVREARWILTHDAEFGSMAIHEGKPCAGIFFLRVRNLRSRYVIGVCN